MNFSPFDCLTPLLPPPLARLPFASDLQQSAAEREADLKERTAEREADLQLRAAEREADRKDAGRRAWKIALALPVEVVVLFAGAAAILEWLRA